MSRAEAGLRHASCGVPSVQRSGRDLPPWRFPLPTARETAATPRALDAHLPWTGKMLGELGLACARLDGARPRWAARAPASPAGAGGSLLRA